MAKLKKGKNTVYFTSEGFLLEGHLWLPQDYIEGEKRPAMILTRPAGGVKEQTTGVYAEKFQEKGFITLAYDVKGFGGSEGIPQNEDPISIIEDAKAAANYLAELKQVDSKNLIQAGPCMGAAYSTCAAIGDDRVSACIQLTPYLTFYEDYPKVWGGQWIMKNIFVPMLKPIKWLRNLTGINIYLYTVPDTWWQRALPNPSILYGMRTYYLKGKPGNVPSWKNKVNLQDTANIMYKYNAFNYLSAYKEIPFFMAYGTRGYSPNKLQNFYDRINAKDKEVMVVDAQHFDMYWKPEVVNPIVDRATAFIHKNLR